MSRLMCITIQQPWAWAIATGAKPVENRTWSTGYRGPLAIHAGKRQDGSGFLHPGIVDAYRKLGMGDGPPHDPRENIQGVTYGAVIAVVQVIGCHPGRLAEPTCCAPWGMPGQFHHEYADVRVLAEPVPMVGALGIRPVPAELVDLILERAT